MKKVLLIVLLISSFMLAGCDIHIDLNAGADNENSQSESKTESVSDFSGAVNDTDVDELSEKTLTEEKFGVRYGYYKADSGDQGEMYSIEDISDTAVSGKHIYKTEFGDYGSFDFKWDIVTTQPLTAAESFQGQDDKIGYKFDCNVLTVSYPVEGQPDKSCTYYCSLEEYKP